MNKYEINDRRSEKEFKGMTFSKYKKSSVKKELLKAMLNNKIEPSCYWSCEYICAGLFADLWEVILTYFSKNIHLGNPKLPLYLELRYTAFKDIVMNGYIGNELSLRNNAKIRKLFAEIIIVLTTSYTKHAYTPVKVDKKDFNMTELTEKLKAPNVKYASAIFKKEDPKEFFIALNELAYHISPKSNNTRFACYWIEWIIEFETICKSKKKYICGRREYVPVQSKNQTDCVWMIWDTLLHQVTKSKSGLIKVIKALLNLFCIRYTHGCKKRRRFIMYFAVSLLTEKFDANKELISSSININKAISKIDIIYAQIKKNEESPATDYLFNNSFTDSEKNLKNTIAKLETMDSLTGFIPRN